MKGRGSPDPALYLQPLKNLLVLVFGMSGLRVDRYRDGSRFVVTCVVWLVFLAANLLVFDWGVLDLDLEALRGLALSYTLAIWAIYYIGNSLVLGYEPLRRQAIRRWGEETAYKRYESVIGIVYLAQGLCQSALMGAYAGTFPGSVPVVLTTLAGITLIVAGTAGKAWATYLTGLDKYYYRDMFIGRDEAFEKKEPYVVRGPYRYFKNPMYGLGYLGGYGLALLHRSWEYLACAAVFHASIYAFYFLFERAFIVRYYLGGASSVRSEPQPAPVPGHASVKTKTPESASFPELSNISV